MPQVRDVVMGAPAESLAAACIAAAAAASAIADAPAVFASETSAGAAPANGGTVAG
jgi:hypothetical protein